MRLKTGVDGLAVATIQCSIYYRKDLEMTAISSAHQRVLSNKREALLRNQEQDQYQNEVLRAKWIQKQTGCTWTEALRAAAKVVSE